MDKTNISTEQYLEDVSISPQPSTKLSIIDHALNHNGMGRYHWLMWAICSSGFFLDAMWASAFTLVLPTIQREFGFSDKELGNIFTVHSIGMVLGSFFWGTLVDAVGRRVAFYGTAMTAGAFGFCVGATSSFSSLQAMVLFVGFGTGGNIPTNSTIALEYLPQRYFYLLTALGVSAHLGILINTIVTFSVVPYNSCSPSLVSCHLTEGVQPCCSKGINMGWRYLFFTLSSITVGIFVLRFFIFPFHESPKFYILKGKDHAAVEVVHKVAAFNGWSCDLTVESLNEKSQETLVMEEVGFFKRVVQEFSRLKLFFESWKMTRVTILLCLIWMFDYGAIGLAGRFLPLILQRKNAEIPGVGLNQTYLDYIIIDSPSIVAVVISVLMVRSPAIGRKWTLIFASLMMSASLCLYNIVNTQAKRVGLNALIVFFSSLFNSALWGWTPEAFPTAIRGTAAGMAMVCAATSATITPLIGAQLLDLPNGSMILLYVAGGSVLMCTIVLLCFPTKDMVVSRHL